MGVQGAVVLRPHAELVVLEDVLVPSFLEVVDYSKRFQVNLRTAAYMLGIQRVVDTIKTRGIYA